MLSSPLVSEQLFNSSLAYLLPPLPPSSDPTNLTSRPPNQSMHLLRKLNVHILNTNLLMAMADEVITNTNSLKIRLAYTFIRALGRIKKQGPRCKSAPPSTVQRRRRQIKLAAYTSMASAAGYRKYSWSRAVLARRLKRRSAGPPHHDVMRRKKKQPPRRGDNRSRTEKLRQIVPGGESMDVCTLLDETAHFIMCLEAQVQVMQSVLMACPNDE